MTTERKRLSLTDKMRYGAMIVEAEEQKIKQKDIRIKLGLSQTFYNSCKTIYLNTTLEAEKNRKLQQEETEEAVKEQRRILAKAVLLLKDAHPKSYEYVAKYVCKVQEMEQSERLEAAKAAIEEKFKKKLAAIEDSMISERIDLDHMINVGGIA